MRRILRKYAGELVIVVILLGVLGLSVLGLFLDWALLNLVLEWWSR